MIDFLYDLINVPFEYKWLLERIAITSVYVGLALLCLSVIYHSFDKSTGEVRTYDAVRKEIS